MRFEKRDQPKEDFHNEAIKIAKKAKYDVGVLVLPITLCTILNFETIEFHVIESLFFQVTDDPLTINPSPFVFEVRTIETGKLAFL